MRTLIDVLRFHGLVVTDALEMKGIAGHDDVCARALIAGNDVVLSPRNLKKEIDGVMSALKKGRLSEADIDRKCRKVLSFKYALGLSSWKKVPLRHGNVLSDPLLSGSVPPCFPHSWTAPPFPCAIG